MEDSSQIEGLFCYASISILGKAKSFSSTWRRRFVAHFGVDERICARLWESTTMQRPESAQPKHLLFSLLLLKIYRSENVLATMCRVDEKTFRKWAWRFVELISDLKYVRVRHALKFFSYAITNTNEDTFF